MHHSWDDSISCGYLYLAGENRHKLKTKCINDRFNIDYDDGKMFGIEILGKPSAIELLEVLTIICRNCDPIKFPFILEHLKQILEKYVDSDDTATVL